MRLSEYSLHFVALFISRLIGVLSPVPPEHAMSPPGVMSRSSVPCRPHTPWFDGWIRERLRHHSASSTLSRLWPTGSSQVSLSITARYFSSSPSDSTSRWTPCPPVAIDWLVLQRGLFLGCFRRFQLRARLGCALFSHTGQRGTTPAFGYGAPYLGTRGTLTLLIWALPSTHYGLC